MQRPGDTLHALLAIAVAAGAGAVLLTPLPAIFIGAGYTILSALLLGWHAAVLVSHRRPDAVVLARPPWIMLASNVLLLAVCALPLAVPIPRDGIGFLFLPVFLFGLIYLGYLPTTLLYWVADGAGLRQQALVFARTFAWPDIDWVYPASQTTTQSVYFVPVAKWTEETLLVEAGPRRTMRVVLKAPLIAAAGKPLLDAIRERATSAAFGFDQLPMVNRRRALAQGPSLPQDYHPPTSLRDAVHQLRGGTTPPGAAIFRARTGAIWANLLSLAGAGVFLVAGSVFLVATGTVIGGQFLPRAWSTPLVLLIATAVEAVVAAAFGVWFIVLGLRWVRAVRDPNGFFFLVTPDYFGEVRGDRVKGLPFAEVSSISTESGGMLGLELVVKLRDHSKLTYDFGKTYGPVRDIHSYMLAAHNARAPRHPSTPFGARMEGDVDAG
jgi:hypothetical protein